MESLLANYASSDDEDDQNPNQPITSSFFSYPPSPKSSFMSLSTPRQPSPVTSNQGRNPTISSSSSLFSSLPQPKSRNLQDQDPLSNSAPSHPSTTKKRVVQIRAPIISPSKSNDSDEDDELERTRRKQSNSVAQAPPSVTSFLSSIPAPRNSSNLGALSNSGTGRRSIIETETLTVSTAADFEVGNHVSAGIDQYSGNSDAYASYNSDFDQTTTYSGDYGGNHEHYQSGTGQNNDGNTTNYVNYETCGGYEHSGNNWNDGSVTTMSSTSSENALRVLGKRGRNVIPTEIVEVKQDELMKNRPKEDQAKLTGIAFGPSYQPVSTKGKPNKLHKRKHQIGTLFYDMKQKEMELSERRAKGFLTKSETQAKYGW